MLELKNIRKEYPAGSGKVEALKGISLRFRENEFVSILGPSGCGKTTMLNIIGGLDGYTEGDLVIRGVSTRKYKDRDWDAYRNHTIGFVFQSYNLIPHQSVLQNVELALTLSGVSRAERRKRAIQALEDVGLGDQLRKKPGEMSGGQMQRVAIARALVNDPDIILADEPTGALDTETSVQVMEILKKISEKRLIIMVTHNPELAEKYSTRIIRMLDGVITSDSMPVEADDRPAAPTKTPGRQRRPSMSFATSFMLSLKNLFTKKGRTLLTSFAGSIGIIGIALILSISQGMTNYINAVQESTLSAYPLTLQASTVEMSSLMKAFMNVVSSETTHENDAVYEKAALHDMINAMSSIEESENDLNAFRRFLEDTATDGSSDLARAINGVQYAYDLDLQIYTQSVDGVILQSDLEEIMLDLMLEYMGTDMSAMTAMRDMSPMAGAASMSQQRMSLWQELLPGTDGAPVNDLILDQYEVVYGAWPNSHDEIVLVVDEHNELDDVTLYALGLLSQKDMDKLASGALNRTGMGENEVISWSYEEICKADYRVILNADCYHYDEATGLYTDLRETEAGLRYLYESALPLRVTGIIRPRADADTTMLTGAICYTSALTEHLADKAAASHAVQAQKASPDRDVITGLPFGATTGSLTDAQKADALRAWLASLDNEGKAKAYVAISSIPPEEVLAQQTAAALGSMTRADIEAALSQDIGSQMSVSAEEISAYLAALSDEDLNGIFSQLLREQIADQYAQQMTARLAGRSADELATGLTFALPTYTAAQCALYYDEIMTFSPSTYEANLKAMGCFELDTPASISIYASSFENKDVIVAAIDEYNASVPELQRIKYTDYLGIMMSSITTIINAITYVLIAFVAISLVVSSIMIGVITLISVQERTKEIGILRAIGASKKNVSRMFNAETMIVGFTSGLLGVGVTYLLCIPINLILNHLTGIANLRAVFPVPAAVILVVISVLLTLISGIIPSRSAARKDPVVALRTE